MSESKKLAQFSIDSFLRSPESRQYNLTIADTAVLMALGNHLRNEDNCYPSQEYLADYLFTSRDTILRSIKKLIKLNLIKSFKKPSIDKRSKFSLHNYYSLTEVIHRPAIDSMQHVADSNVLSCNRSLIAMQCVANSYTNITTNKTIKEKREAGAVAKRATRALSHPIDETFKPDQERLAICSKLQLNADLVTQKFIAYGKSKGMQSKDPQAAFELFALNEKSIYHQKHKLTLITNEQSIIKSQEKETTCNVCKRPDHYCQCYRSQEQREKNHLNMRDLMKNLRLIPKGIGNDPVEATSSLP